MANTALDGKPYAGNPHVRIDEGDGASAKPRRSSLLYKSECCWRRWGRAALSACVSMVLFSSLDGQTVPLPYGYTRLEYVETTTVGQYVKTGYTPKAGDKVTCVCWVKKGQASGHHWATVFGARTSNGNASYTFFSHAGNASGGNGVQYNRSSGSSGSTGVNSKAFPYEKKVALVCDGPAATWTKMEGGTTGSINLGISPVDSTCPLFLFCLNIGAAGAELVHNNCYCEMELSSFKVTTPANGDTPPVVQRDYVAGRTKAGEVGLLDRAHNNGFVKNAGTGAFAWGGLAFTERGTTLIAREGTLSADDLAGYTDVEGRCCHLSPASVFR